MSFDPTNPFIVQGDRSILVEVENPKYGEGRDALAPFAELEKSPEHIHTYKLTNLSLWNAAAAGMKAEEMLDVLRKYSKFPIPANLPSDIKDIVSRYGRLRLERFGDKLKLVSTNLALLEEIGRLPKLKEILGDRIDEHSFVVDPAHRGILKQALVHIGYPAEDLAGYTEGAALAIGLREIATSGLPFHEIGRAHV